MSLEHYDVKAPRKAANLSINSDLLRRAKALNLNLSRLLEERLVEIVRQAECDRWLAENRSALEHYNARVEREGLFSDELRSF